MENQKLCPSCMRPLSADDAVCPHCKYAVDKQNPAGYLPVGTVLQEHYLIGRALGSYGDACLYIGYDKLLKSAVFIREFFPADFCRRSSVGSVLPVKDREEDFDRCRTAFFVNVRALAKMKELPSLLPLYDIFTENDTVYAVHDHCEGHSLARTLKSQGGRMTWSEIRPLFMQLMASVSTLHRAGVYHLAISPDTIFVGEDGKLRLRGFAIDEARRAGTALKPRLSAGYAAPEQYVANKECGAAADVYGLAATLFTALTGTTPPEAPQRVKGSQDLFLPADVAEELPEEVGLALFNALQTDVNKRLQSVDALREALSAEPAVNALLEDAPELADEQPQQKKKFLLPLLIGVAVFSVLAVAAIILLLFLFPPKTELPEDADTGITTTLPTFSTTTAPQSSNAITVPALTGRNYYEYNGFVTVGDTDVKMEIEYLRYDDKQPRGVILSQTPAADTVLTEDTVIKVVISLGAEEVSLPNVAGWPKEHAQAYLEALGFRVDPLTVNVSNYEKGLVDGTDPAPGTALKPGALITLRVSDAQPVEENAETETETDTETTP